MFIFNHFFQYVGLVVFFYYVQVRVSRSIIRWFLCFLTLFLLTMHVSFVFILNE